MNRNVIAISIASFGVFTLIAVIVLVNVFRTRSLFEGERSKELGTKQLVAGKAVFSDQFELRNVSGLAVHVLALRPNCSCVHAELPRTVIPAGETLVIPFTMTLEKPGEKGAYIDVLFPEDHIESLRLHAFATE